MRSRNRSPFFIAWLCVFACASCGTPTAATPDDDVFAGDLGFVTKLDAKTKDVPAADVMTDAPVAGDVAKDVAPDAKDAAADETGSDVDVAAEVALVDATEDANDDTEADESAASDVETDDTFDVAEDGTTVVDDGPPALCRPCLTDAACGALNPTSVCVNYGQNGSYCGSGCVKDLDCPTGYVCADAEGTSGPAASKQCLKKNGECTCSTQSIADAAFTTCTSSNPIGSCSGKRTCLATGLAACDAPTPKDEVCNGVDDNCDGVTDGKDTLGCTLFYDDKDGDGIGFGNPTCLCSNAGTSLAVGNTDCDDNNFAVYPGAVEICNDADDNCDGKTDEGCDADGDGWCNTSATIDGAPKVCSKGAGDCNDKSAAVHPGAAEICGNSVDDNCDGETDVGGGGPGCTAFYVDGDGDGFGAGVSQCSCTATGNYTVTAAGDCNDADADVNPKAKEVCSNGKDDDCNGKKDEGAGIGCTPWYTDADKDGFGIGAATCLCVADATHTANKNGDCNDNAASISPGATETCNNKDDDCNGVTDDGPPVDCVMFYADGDKDTYGGGPGVCLCAADAAHPVSIGGDCNDASSAIHPGVTETCNGYDDNCNSQTDELGAKGCSNFHVDADGDTYGGSDVKCACSADPVYNTLDASDCDDTSAAVNPNAAEICDGLDNNCDGTTDPPGLSTCVVYFLDSDVDGYGTSQAQVKCLCGPSGLWSTTTPGDCNDTDKAIHPGATEVCNNKDDNCDGTVDNGAGTIYYADGDGDTYGNPAVSLQSCTPLPTLVTNKLDCDDGNAAVHPGVLEICDGKDNDCNGQTDDGLCDDGNGCTVDVCSPGSGCTHTPTNGACTDGSACTTGDTCATGTCKGTTINCDDGNACTNDACAPASGCTHVNNTTACNDGNACTSDACSGGTCTGTAISCDDGDACTTDACVPASGCTHTQTCTGLPFADAGNTYAEGLTTAGTLKAWGNAATPPTGTYAQVSAGYYFACVVTSGGSMNCWGANKPTALTNKTITGVKQVSVGNPHACIIKTDGTLQCWSASGTTTTTGIPSGAFTQVSCGYDHSCALRADGSVTCWGGNTYGQTTVPTGETFTQITAGDYFSCGIRKNGGIKCWGDDAFYPVSKAPSTGSFIAISAGNSACAIKSDNTMVCWTLTSFGSSTPPANTKWLSLGAGEDVVCGVLTNKTVKCFGDDYNSVVSGVPASGW